jgi:uncharacterized spore protein YtfJ
MTSRKLRALEPHLGLHLLPLLRDGTHPAATATAAAAGAAGAAAPGLPPPTSSSPVPLHEVDVRELAKAAEALREIEALVLDPTAHAAGATVHPAARGPAPAAGGGPASRGNDLDSGPGGGGGGAWSVAQVAVVAAEAPFVAFVGEGVRVLAGAKLRAGMAALNQTDVGGALQVFFNLGIQKGRHTRTHTLAHARASFLNMPKKALQNMPKKRSNRQVYVCLFCLPRQPAGARRGGGGRRRRQSR